MAIRIGIIGAGGIGIKHLNDLKTIGRTEIKAICDIDEQKAKSAQETFGGETYLDFIKMLDAQALDAVLICTPQTVRYAPIKEAAVRGIPIFCEKPPAFSLDDARRVEQVLKEAPVINSVGFMWRYNRIMDRAKDLIKGHTVSLMRSALLCDAALNPSLPRWFLLKERSGGPLLDQAIHLLDASRYILGDIAYVQSFGNNLVLPKTGEVTVEDSHSLNLRFASGTIGNHLHSWSHRGWVARIELYGNDIALTLDYAANSIYGNIKETRVQEKMSDDPYITELERFLDAVERKDQTILRSPYADAVKTLAVAIAANKSFGTGMVEQIVT